MRFVRTHKATRLYKTVVGKTKRARNFGQKFAHEIKAHSMGCVSVFTDVAPVALADSVAQKRLLDKRKALRADNSSVSSSLAKRQRLSFFEIGAKRTGQTVDARFSKFDAPANDVSRDSSDTPVFSAPPRPFVKWAGGKRQLLSALLHRVPGSFRAYHEPFVGGGALFFALFEQKRLSGKIARLTDINRELINAYQVVRDRVETLIALLSTFKNDQDFYYEIRALDPARLDAVQRAARFIFLNKTCFNGLFRENRKGQFNVPFGYYKNAQFCAPNDLRAASWALRNVCLEVASFVEIEQVCSPGDFVYFDPPYAPTSKTASFVAYNSSGFDEQAQRQLATLVRLLAERGVHVLLSNSSVPFTKQLYGGLRVETVAARRAINSCGEKRGSVEELLVSVF